MIRVETDPGRNLLIIIFTGHVGVDEIGRHEQNVKEALARLKPGFRLLTDLVGLESMDVETAPFVQRVMDLCNERCIKQVIRVIPDPRKDIGLSIMSFFHYRRGVKIVTCETLAEALKIIEATDSPAAAG